jgi:hypothetical protein
MKRQIRKELDIKILALALQRLMKDYRELRFFASEGPEWFFESWLESNMEVVPDNMEKALLNLFVSRLMGRRYGR